MPHRIREVLDMGSYRAPTGGRKVLIIHPNILF